MKLPRVLFPIILVASASAIAPSAFADGAANRR
jgi:hypothetical protein